MTQKRSRPAPLATVTSLGWISSAASVQMNTATSLREQHEIDVVGLLAARSGVDPTSVRHQLSAFGFEVRS